MHHPWSLSDQNIIIIIVLIIIILNKPSLSVTSRFAVEFTGYAPSTNDDYPSSIMEWSLEISLPCSAFFSRPRRCKHTMSHRLKFPMSLISHSLLTMRILLVTPASASLEHVKFAQTHFPQAFYPRVWRSYS